MSGADAFFLSWKIKGITGVEKSCYSTEGKIVTTGSPLH